MFQDGDGMMKPEFIVMLTNNDTTVANALELFEELRDIPIRHWGFKDVGLPRDRMKSLVKNMKDAGKVTCLEVVSLTETDGLAGARLAVEAGFDYLMGTVYYDSINDYLADKAVLYYPFPGHVHGHPSILDGSVEQIVEHACQLESNGVDGLDLLTYRYTGDAQKLLQEVVRATNVPVISAGSIATFDRIAEVWSCGAWGFTIGSALIQKRMAPDSSIRDNVLTVWNWLQQTNSLV
jgi:hypothetical protein